MDIKIILYTIFYNALITNANYKSVYQLYEVTAFNTMERSKLYKMHMDRGIYIFVSGVSNEAAIPNRVIVNNKSIDKFERRLQHDSLQYYYVTQLIMEAYEEINRFHSPQYVKIADSFYNWPTIQHWINSYDEKLSIIQKYVITKTFEGRNIIMIKISVAANNPAVVIVGGEEGMDWMSSAVILNFLNNLMLQKQDMQELLQNFDFYIIPILNPDGFEHSKRKDRFWTKNRKPILKNGTCNNQNDATGVSLTRNWFLKESNNISELQDLCQAIYFGDKPLSEEETQGLSYILNSIALNMIAFINLRGFGNHITIPYSFTSKPSNNHDIMMEILKTTNNIMKFNFNLSFSIGTSENIFYNSTGNVADWVKKKLNTPIVFTVHMSHEDSFQQLPKHIASLSTRFYTILNYSLQISKILYGPLFNNQLKLTQTHYIYTLNFIILLKNMIWNI